MLITNVFNAYFVSVKSRSTCYPSCRCQDHIYMWGENRLVLRCNSRRHVAFASPETIGRISAGPHNYSLRTALVADYLPADNSNRQSKKCDCEIRAIRTLFSSPPMLILDQWSSFEYSLMFVNWTSNDSIFELHSSYNLIVIIFPTVDFAHVGGQMGIYETNERFVQLQTNANATFIALFQWWANECFFLIFMCEWLP